MHCFRVTFNPGAELRQGDADGHLLLRAAGWAVPQRGAAVHLLRAQIELPMVTGHQRERHGGHVWF